MTFNQSAHTSPQSLYTEMSNHHLAAKRQTQRNQRILQDLPPRLSDSLRPNTAHKCTLSSLALKIKQFNDG